MEEIILLGIFTLGNCALAILGLFLGTWFNPFLALFNAFAAGFCASELLRRIRRA